MKQNTTSSNNANPVTLFEGRLTLRIPEVAQALSVSESTVRRMIRRGHLKPLRIVRHILVPVDQLSKLVNGEGS